MLGLRTSVREHYGRRRVSASRHMSGVVGATFENYTLGELIVHLERKRASDAVREILARYRVQRTFPDMNDFRLGPNPFDETALDWIILMNADESELVAHGIATRIRWDGEYSSLPRGWTGAVRASYEESVLGSVHPTTLVGLFIFAENAYREHGWAAEIATEMKRVAADSGLRDVIIPLRLPTRYEWQFARMPYEEFAFLRRDDGDYRDHWLRMHVRLGAEILGVCPVSHQHGLHPDDLRRQAQAEPFQRSGEYVVRIRDEYYSAFVDLERQYSIINEGCVWVRHAV